MKKKIANMVQKYKNEIIDLTCNLVKINSVTGNEGEIIDYLQKQMKNIGFDEVFVDNFGNLIGRMGNGDIP